MILFSADDTLLNAYMCTYLPLYFSSLWVLFLYMSILREKKVRENVSRITESLGKEKFGGFFEDIFFFIFFFHHQPARNNNWWCGRKKREEKRSIPHNIIVFLWERMERVWLDWESGVYVLNHYLSYNKTTLVARRTILIKYANRS